MSSKNNFPELINIKAISKVIDNGFDEFIINFSDRLEALSLPLLKFLIILENLLLWSPWYVVVLLFATIAWFATKSIKITISIVFLVLAMGLLGLWNQSMQTIALMLAATISAILIGIPMGILMSRSDRFQNVMMPVLDIMQTMPIFVYLIPFVMIFGVGKIPALLATLVFALPPLIRLTNLGIRQVSAEVIEAVSAFGATGWQKLLSAQIPLAMPTIMAGINQTTMMSLSMVVIASMIGAGGLGYQVLQGIQRLELSKGLFAGLGIVFLAIIFDRIVQGYGKKIQQHLHLDN